MTGALLNKGILLIGVSARATATSVGDDVIKTQDRKPTHAKMTIIVARKARLLCLTDDY